MVVEHAHGLRQRRGPSAALSTRHSPPDAGLQAPGASLSQQGSHDFESLDVA